VIFDTNSDWDLVADKTDKQIEKIISRLKKEKLNKVLNL
jgi:hypothetical protein